MLDDVMTKKLREVQLNLRVNPEIREDFRIAAEMRGATMSGLLHQFIIRTIRDEKEQSPREFERRRKELEQVEMSFRTALPAERSVKQKRSTKRLVLPRQPKNKQ